MAEFLAAYKKTCKSEGGYVNDPHDSGGETYKGVSRRNFPTWQGWKVVDNCKPLERNETIESAELDGMVKNCFKVNFWDKIRGDEIESQDTAEMMFDMAINAGISTAVKLIQNTLGLPETGIMNNALLSNINNPNIQV